LNQATRARNKKINGFTLQQKFVKCANEHDIYRRNSTNKPKFVACLYADDVIVTGTDES